eukprot:GHVL01023948.1.p2 GENE.GHVL01023948.1~~GHVL01023948.1.p2  ORF type:complete len:104 (+),score=23.41 GHVL01023948.1:882-1193(+)
MTDLELAAAQRPRTIGQPFHGYDEDGPMKPYGGGDGMMTHPQVWGGAMEFGGGGAPIAVVAGIPVNSSQHKEGYESAPMASPSERENGSSQQNSNSASSNTNN